MNALGGKFPGAANVVNVIGVSAINQDVVLAQFGKQVGNRGIHDRGRNHQPNGAGLLQLGHKLLEGSGARGALAGKLLHGIGVAIVRDALVSGLLQAAHHVRAHSSQSDHSKLHGERPPQGICLMGR